MGRKKNQCGTLSIGLNAALKIKKAIGWDLPAVQRL